MYDLKKKEDFEHILINKTYIILYENKLNNFKL